MDSEVSNASTPDSDSNCAGYFARALFARLQMVTYHEGHGTCPRMKESDHELSNIHLSCPVSLECPLLALFCSSWKAAHAGPLFPAFLWEYHPVHPAGASQSYCFMNLQIMPWMGGWRLEVPYLQNKKCIICCECCDLWMRTPTKGIQEPQRAFQQRPQQSRRRPILCCQEESGHLALSLVQVYSGKSTVSDCRCCMLSQMSSRATLVRRIKKHKKLCILQQLISCNYGIHPRHLQHVLRNAPFTGLSRGRQKQSLKCMHCCHWMQIWDPFIEDRAYPDRWSMWYMGGSFFWRSWTGKSMFPGYVSGVCFGVLNYVLRLSPQVEIPDWGACFAGAFGVCFGLCFDKVELPSLT